jgi:hypothetical protein
MTKYRAVPKPMQESELWQVIIERQVGTIWVFDELVKDGLSHRDALVLAKQKNDQFE